MPSTRNSRACAPAGSVASFTTLPTVSPRLSASWRVIRMPAGSTAVGDACVRSATDINNAAVMVGWKTILQEPAARDGAASAPCGNLRARRSEVPPMDEISRRDFLQMTAGAGAFATLARPAGDVVSAQPAAGAAADGWFDRPMRWVQLTLVENDPGRFDPQFWLDYFRRLHADAATLSAGGIVAYYPTAIPLHHRSQWLGESDPFGTLAAGCSALGMNVLARTDPHAAREDVRAAHPDWIAVTRDGEPRRHWANPDLWVTCALG